MARERLTPQISQAPMARERRAPQIFRARMVRERRTPRIDRKMAGEWATHCTEENGQEARVALKMLRYFEVARIDMCLAQYLRSTCSHHLSVQDERCVFLTLQRQSSGSS